MKKFLMMLMIMSLMISGIETARAAIMLKNNAVVAVMPYLDKSTKSAELQLRDATLVSEYLIEDLLKTGQFQIPEREFFQAIINEHSINHSDLTNPSTMVSTGKLVGAQYIAVGSVTGLSAKKSGIDIGVDSDEKNIGADFNKYTVIANVTLRIVDLETGLVVVATSGTGKSARTSLGFTLSQAVQNYYGEEGTTTPPTDGAGNNGIINNGNINDGNTNDGNINDGDNNNNSENEGSEMESEDVPMDEMSAETFNIMPLAFYFDEGEGGAINSIKFKIGSEGFGAEQVHNALRKAIKDAVKNMIANLDGTAKKRKA